MAKIKLTNHAKTRLMERGISSVAVKQVVDNPTTTEEEENGKVRMQGEDESGRRIIVICQELRKNQFLIITAYYAN